MDGTGTGLCYQDLMGFTVERIHWEIEAQIEFTHQLAESRKPKT